MMKTSVSPDTVLLTDSFKVCIVIIFCAHNMFVCPDFVWTIFPEPFISKLGVVVYYHEPECHVEKLVCCLQGQGHSKGIYHKKRLLLLYFLNFRSICNQIWLMVHHHKPKYPVEHWIAVHKIKVSAKDHNVNK